MNSTAIAWVILALVVLQRLGELALAKRNTAALLARGAVEIGARHYPFIVALHALWLLVTLWQLPNPVVIHWALLALFLVFQGLRLWVVATLGIYWTTRIISLPGVPLVRRGPYRFFRHPNYMAVAGEIALLPLVFGEIRVAIIFSFANAAILALRIRQEETGLTPRRACSGSEDAA